MNNLTVSELLFTPCIYCVTFIWPQFVFFLQYAVFSDEIAL